MKKLTHFAVVLFIVAMALPSCLKDDDNNNNTTRILTQQEKTRSLLAAQGSFTGKLYYYNNTNKTDSIDIHWTVTGNDSILSITDFPISAFSNSVYADSNTVNILKNAPTKELRFMLHGYYNTRFDDGFYSFSMSPLTMESIIVSEENGEKEETLTFTYANYLQDYTIYGQPVYTYPICEYINGQMQGYILVGGVAVNAKSLTVNKVYYFYGKKN